MVPDEVNMSTQQTITPSDHALAQKAHHDYLRASATWEFIHNHLVGTYQILPGDTIDIATGIITRGPQEAPALPEKKKREKPAKAEVTD